MNATLNFVLDKLRLSIKGLNTNEIQDISTKYYVQEPEDINEYLDTLIILSCPPLLLIQNPLFLHGAMIVQHSKESYTSLAFFILLLSISCVRVSGLHLNKYILFAAVESTCTFSAK